MNKNIESDLIKYMNKYIKTETESHKLTLALDIFNELNSYVIDSLANDIINNNNEKQALLAYHALSHKFFILNDYDNSLKNLDKAINIALSINDTDNLPMLYADKAEIYYKLEDIDSSKLYINKSIELDKDMKDIRWNLIKNLNLVLSYC